MSTEGHNCGPNPCPECDETHDCICGNDCDEPHVETQTTELLIEWEPEPGRWTAYEFLHTDDVGVGRARLEHRRDAHKLNENAPTLRLARRTVTVTIEPLP